ncbi:MAG TPA: hypothetical protein VEY30_05095, partial [Myxococcaceae bacterium]|nr:hypothetical protein [Myxococcaceae bacterium]
AGWHGVEFWEDHLWANHRVISGTGQTLALWSEGSGVEPDLGTRNRAVSISPDPSPSGGSFVVATERAKGSSSSFEVRGHRFAADGAALASVLVGTANMDTQPNEAWVAAGVSAAGPSLGILPWHGPLSWTWHGREGNELARAVLGPRPVREDAQPTLHPLLDGSLVAQVEGEWQLRFPLSGASSEPPPPWLPNGHRVAVIRNRRGHALLPLPREGTVPCEQRVEIRSASGLACGAVVFRLSEAACSTRDISVGRDGTVIQQTALEACSEGTCTCTHRWWPGLFQ